MEALTQATPAICYRCQHLCVGAYEQQHTVRCPNGQCDEWVKAGLLQRLLSRVRGK